MGPFPSKKQSTDGRKLTLAPPARLTWMVFAGRAAGRQGTSFTKDDPAPRYFRHRIRKTTLCRSGAYYQSLRDGQPGKLRKNHPLYHAPAPWRTIRSMRKNVPRKMEQDGTSGALSLVSRPRSLTERKRSKPAKGRRGPSETYGVPR